MCVALFHFNVPVSHRFRVTGRMGHVIAPKLFFFNLAAVTSLDLILSFPVEISAGDDVSLKPLQCRISSASDV